MSYLYHQNLNNISLIHNDAFFVSWVISAMVVVVFGKSVHLHKERERERKEQRLTYDEHISIYEYVYVCMHKFYVQQTYL